MRILMMSSLWPPHVLGGAEIYASMLAAELRHSRDTVGVVTLGVPGPDVVGQVPPYPYRLDKFSAQPRLRRARFHLADVYRPASKRALVRVFEEFEPDVVHSHAIQGFSGAALAVPSELRIPHVHTIHDYWLQCQRSSLVRRDGVVCERRCRSCTAFSSARLRLIGRNTPDVVIGVSDAVLREHDTIDWVRQRSRVIPNPVFSRPVPARATGRPLTFGYLGQLIRAKGIRTLLDAFERADLGDARLLVAGDGPLRPAVQAAKGQVQYLGFVADKEKEAFFETIDCLVVPSEWRDPAPLVINEARSYRLPVIGADMGGIPELVAPACVRLLFRSGDSEQLALRLGEFARSPTAYRDHCEQTLNWSEHVDLIHQAYSDAIAAHGTQLRTSIEP